MIDLLNLYKKYLDFTEEQNRLINEEDYDELLNIISQKQELIDVITQYKLEEYIFRQEEPEQIKKKLESIMQGIKKLEEQNKLALETKKSSLKNKLKSLSLGAKRRRGYEAANYEAKFIDKKG